jgi:integrase
MTRHVRNARLDSRSARLKLKDDNIHRQSLGGKLHLGYRQGKGAGVWIARRYLGDGKYTTETIGEADDLADANGDTVLNFDQAQKKARKWASDLDEKERIAALGPVVTVRDAVNEYLKERSTALDARGKLKHVLADTALAETPLAGLEVDDLKRWRASLLAKEMSESSARRVANDARAALNAAAKRHRKALPETIRDTIRDGFAVTKGAQVDNLREKQILSDADIRRLIKATLEIDEQQGWGGDLFRMIVVLAQTGARFSQVVRLRVVDLEIEQGRLMVPSSLKGTSDSKASHIPVPILPEVVDALRPAVAGRRGHDLLLLCPRWRREPGPGFGVMKIYERGPWRAASSLTHVWKAIVARAGLKKGIIPYALRHSSIVRGLRTMPVQLVGRLHDTSAVMIERYYSRFIISGLDDLARAALIPMMPKPVTKLSGKLHMVRA